jgi:hypothetical protein
MRFKMSRPPWSFAWAGKLANAGFAHFAKRDFLGPLHHRDDQSTSVIRATAITLRSRNRDGVLTTVMAHEVIRKQMRASVAGICSRRPGAPMMLIGIGIVMGGAIVSFYILRIVLGD